ncbi:MAG: iron-sulfur cluster assembly scaffold protein [Spirochaetaceae bacterium]|nr:iron-sulfur cluster assembly scaffold protein [Spirochaetaceae bacterium]
MNREDVKNFGRMNDPSASAWIKGLCGDTMEMYLVIENNVIKEARFYTDGCISTCACGSLTAELVMGRNYYKALSISPNDIIESLKNLPEQNHHCAILAVSTLYKAIANYMLQY